jgi:hypothetical protein
MESSRELSGRSHSTAAPLKSSAVICICRQEVETPPHPHFNHHAQNFFFRFLRRFHAEFAKAVPSLQQNTGFQLGHLGNLKKHLLGGFSIARIDEFSGAPERIPGFGQ